MDWDGADDAEPSGDGMPAAQQPSFISLPSPSHRRLGRLISHKKSASDTFAFAAGNLFQLDQEHINTKDFLTFLEAPVEELHHGRHASAGCDNLEDGVLEPVDSQQLPDAVDAVSEPAICSLQAQAIAARPGSLYEAPTPAMPLAGAAAAAHSPAAMALATARSSPALAPTSPRAGGTLWHHLGTAESFDAADDAEEAAAAAAGGPGSTQTRANALDTTQLDPRRAKRILANRQSAQRSRMKRLQYIHDLEGKKAEAAATVKELNAKLVKMQAKHAGLSGTVEAKKTQLAALTQQLVYEQGMQANLHAYIQALQLQQQQQQQQWQHMQHVPAAGPQAQTQPPWQLGGGVMQDQYDHYTAASSQHVYQHAPQQQQQQQQQQQHTYGLCGPPQPFYHHHQQQQQHHQLGELQQGPPYDQQQQYLQQQQHTGPGYGQQPLAIQHDYGYMQPPIDPARRVASASAIDAAAAAAAAAAVAQHALKERRRSAAAATATANGAAGWC